MVQISNFNFFKENKHPIVITLVAMYICKYCFTKTNKNVYVALQICNKKRKLFIIFLSITCSMFLNKFNLGRNQTLWILKPCQVKQIKYF